MSTGAETEASVSDALVLNGEKRTRLRLLRLLTSCAVKASLTGSSLLPFAVKYFTFHQ